MSDNLLEGLTPMPRNGATAIDGGWQLVAYDGDSDHQDQAIWDLADQSAVETNQTMTASLALRGDAAMENAMKVSVGYKDGAGKLNWYGVKVAVATGWEHAFATLVVPAGMTPARFYLSPMNGSPAMQVANVSLRFGGRVTLASACHTPYVTDEHASAVYATKSSLTVQADRITSEVSKTYTKSETFSAYQSDADSRIATANTNASTAVSTAKTAASDAATAKTNAATAVDTANSAKSTAGAAGKTASGAASDASSAVTTANKAASDASAAKDSAAKAQSDLASFEGTVETTYATKAALTEQADRITSEVSARQQTDANLSELSTKVTQTETSITTEITDRKQAVSDAQAAAVSSANSATDSKLSSYTKTADLASADAVKDAKKAGTDAQATANATATMIRQYAGGVLVCKTGNSVGALVNADGSFQVVKVTWSGGTPTVGAVISNMDGDSVDLAIGQASSVITMCGGKGRVAFNSSAGQVFIQGTGGTVLSYDPGTGVFPDIGIGVTKNSAGAWRIYGAGNAEFANDVSVAGSLKVGGSPVVSSGSNGNGRFIKLCDGTMICTKQLAVSTSCNSEWAGHFETPEISLGSLPATFASTPTISITNVGGSAAFVENVGNVSTTSWGSTYLCRPNSIDTLSVTLHMVAIGTWK